MFAIFNMDGFNRNYVFLKNATLPINRPGTSRKTSAYVNFGHNQFLYALLKLKKIARAL